MIYKCVGTGLLLLVGGYLSVFMVRLERKRLTVIEGYISLLRLIKGQIDCYATPMEEILAVADPQLLADCVGGEIDPPLMLPEMIACSRLYLEPESERLLLAFASEIGQNHRAEVVMRCEHYIQALNSERQALVERAPLRMRACCALCLCATLGVAVLLW